LGLSWFYRIWFGCVGKGREITIKKSILFYPNASEDKLGFRSALSESRNDYESLNAEAEDNRSPLDQVDKPEEENLRNNDEID